MNCPLCNVALKAAAHRGVGVNYCPLCGGTWLDRYRFDNLSPTAVPGRPAYRRVLRIAVITALVLAGCLAVTVTVGAVKLWPAVRSWTESLLAGKGAVLNSQLRDLAGRLGEGRGLDGAVVSELAGNSAFSRLLNSVAAAPELRPLVQNGAYLAVLQEAARQNVSNLADLKLERTTSPDLHRAVTQVQQVLKKAPGGGGAAGTVDPAVLELLGSNAFQQLSRSGIFERLFAGTGRSTQVD